MGFGCGTGLKCKILPVNSFSSSSPGKSSGFWGEEVKCRPPRSVLSLIEDVVDVSFSGVDFLGTDERLLSYRPGATWFSRSEDIL